ncbi:hypothetical protein ACIO1C_29575 [Streptomyces sp. NPDC087420]|uniref:hypothetical protein n=1 Tax=Streptomyces sp. NPDC087420 TaxID=3365785 RepID=UPI0038388E58
MALTMSRERSSVRFLWADGEVESTVSLLPEDDEEALVRKLKRIIALVEGEQPARAPSALFNPIVRDLHAPPGAQYQPPTLGWAKPMAEPPAVPEGADYELIPPEEQV